MTIDSTVAEMDARHASPATSRLPAFLMAAISLIVSTISLSFDPRSGASTEFMLEHLGVDRGLPVGYPIWQGLFALMDRLPMGTLSFRAGVLSVLAGGLCVYLLTRILQQARRDYVSPEDVSRTSLFCALPGAGYLLLSMPFLMAADRAHPVLLHLALLLLVIRGLQGFATGGSTARLVGASMAAGLATPEWWGIAVLAPILFLHALKTVGSRSDDVPSGPVLLIMGWVIGLVGALALMQYREFISVPPGVRPPDLGETLTALSDAHRQAFFADSQLALWACFLLGAVLPWLLAVYCSSQMTIGSPVEWAILHLIFTAVAGVFLGIGTLDFQGNAAPLNSLVLLGFVLSAATFGYCCAFWFALFDGELTSEGHVVAGGKPALLVGIVCLFAGSAFLHFPREDLQADKILNKWAKATVRELPDEVVLVGKGPLYRQLVMTAIQADRPIHPISQLKLVHPDYLFSIQQRFASPSLGEVLQSTPGGIQEILLTLPETATRPIAVFDPVAEKTCPWVHFEVGCGVYLANAKRDDIGEHLPPRQEIWDALAEEISGVGPGSDHSILRVLGQHTGRLANDLGVQQYEAGEQESALNSLSVACKLNPQSAIASLNQVLVAADSGGLGENDQAGAALEHVLLGTALESAGDGCLLYPDRVHLLRTSIPRSYSDLPEQISLHEAIVRFLLGGPNALEAAEHGARTSDSANLTGLLIALNGIVAGDPDVLESGMAQVDRSRIKPVPILQNAAQWAIAHENLPLARIHISHALSLDPGNTETLELATLLNLLDADFSPPDSSGQRLLRQDSGNPFASLYQARHDLENGHPEAAAEELSQARNIHRLPVIHLIYANVLQRTSRNHDAQRSARRALASPEITSVTYWRELMNLLNALNRPVLGTYAELRARRLLAARNDAGTMDIEETLLVQLGASLKTVAVVASSPSRASVPAPLSPDLEPSPARANAWARPPTDTHPRPPPHSPARSAPAADPAHPLDDENAEVPLQW